MLSPGASTSSTWKCATSCVPKELQEAMAAEAVAERKKNARMVLAEVEKRHLARC